MTATKITSDWHKEQITRYCAERSDYELMAKTIEDILKRATRVHAPLSIVQSRAKEVSSFAEKAVRKAHKYDNPVGQLTDLCGARVITITEPQMVAMCDFIKENFVVDEANSLDVGARLGPTEFGYRSVHYVVQMKPGAALGVPVSRRLLPTRRSPHKAEIQVRTLLQHAWAEVSHDRIYKNSIRVPRALERDSARLAALTEEAEASFVRFVDRVDSYAANYMVHMTREQIDRELATLDLVLANETNEETRVRLSLRIAAICRSTGQWDRIVKTLRSLAKTGRPEVLRELGNALCLANARRTDSRNFQRGQRLLREAVAANDKDAEAWDFLADSWRRLPDRDEDARHCYRKAYESAPDNPYVLSAFLEYEMYCTRSANALAALAPVARRAIERCQDHVDVCIEIPHAFFTKGKFHLLLGEADECVDSYIRAVAECLSEDCCEPEETFETESLWIERMGRVALSGPSPAGAAGDRGELLRCAQRLLCLAHAIKRQAPFRQKNVTTPGSAGLAPMRGKTSAVMVVGGCDAGVEGRMREFERLLFETLEPFDGVVIGGGTRAGISGLVGAVSARLAKSRKYICLGYHPARMPAHVTLDDQRYDRLVSVENDNFSVMESLQAWTDLSLAGISPGDVKVVMINGGRLSLQEARLALALGARVAVVDGSGRGADQLKSEKADHPKERLLVFPDDPMTLRAFVNRGAKPLGETEQETAGKAIHEDYVKQNHHKSVDPAMRPWKELADGLKEDNRQQAAYATRILADAGYGVRKATRGDVTPIEIDPKKVDRMAEMEHGRWNAKRTMDGWTLGERDPDNKVSPYLVPWDQLPEEIRDYDRTAVKKFPEVFARVGLEVYKL